MLDYISIFVCSCLCIIGVIQVTILVHDLRFTRLLDGCCYV